MYYGVAVSPPWGGAAGHKGKYPVVMLSRIDHHDDQAHDFGERRHSCDETKGTHVRVPHEEQRLSLQLFYFVTLSPWHASVYRGQQRRGEDYSGIRTSLRNE